MAHPRPGPDELLAVPRWLTNLDVRCPLSGVGPAVGGEPGPYNPSNRRPTYSDRSGQAQIRPFLQPKGAPQSHHQGGQHLSTEHLSAEQLTLFKQRAQADLKCQWQRRHPDQRSGYRHCHQSPAMLMTVLTYVKRRDEPEVNSLKFTVTLDTCIDCFNLQQRDTVDAYVKIP